MKGSLSETKGKPAFNPVRFAINWHQLELPQRLFWSVQYTAAELSGGRQSEEDRKRNTNADARRLFFRL